MSGAGRAAGVVFGSGTLLALGAAPAAADVPGAGIIKDVVGGATGWTFGALASGIASWVMGAASDLVAGVVSYLGTSAGPGVDAVWFSGPGSPFALVRNIAGTLLIGFVLLAVIQGVLAGDLAATAGRVLRDLVLAVIGMSAVVVVTVQLLDLIDALSSAVLQGADGHALRFLSGFGAAAGVATGGAALVLIGLVVAFGALLVWVELLVRSALVYLLVALSPLAFAAITWPAARGVLRRTMELLVAVVVSKFVICVTLALGAAALSGAGSASPEGPVAAASLGTLLSGAAVLGLAAFSPFVVLRLIPFAEAAVAAHGVSRSPVRGAQAGAMALHSGYSLARLAGAGGAASRGMAPSTAGSGTQATAGPGRLSGGGAPTHPGSPGPSGLQPPPGTSRASAAAAQGRVGTRGDGTTRPPGPAPASGSHAPGGPTPPRSASDRDTRHNRGRQP